MTQHHSGERTVTLWIRSFEPVTTGPKGDAAIDHLEALADRGMIDNVDIGVWGRQVNVSGSRVPQVERITTALETFAEWAERNGRQLEPFFHRRQINSKITGDSAHVCRLPTCALAEYENDRLVHVAPSRNPTTERTITVEERLEQLAEPSRLSFTDRWSDSDSNSNGDSNRSDDKQDDYLEHSSPAPL